MGQEWATRRGYLLHQLDELTEETPINTAYTLITQQLGGWPMYLLTNVTGHNKHQIQREGRGVGKHNGFGGGVNHFDPNSPLYEAKDAKSILLSDLGLLITASILFWVGRTYGFANLFVWYLAPYLWVNHWLVAITFLQHTDPSLPHYTPTSWTYTRGAAATIDRESGFIGRQLLHGIVETHVLHHYVSTIPFYHADEASEAIKKVMGRHYRSDTTDELTEETPINTAYTHRGSHRRGGWGLVLPQPKRFGAATCEDGEACIVMSVSIRDCFRASTFFG